MRTRLGALAGLTVAAAVLVLAGALPSQAAGYPLPGQDRLGHQPRRA